MASIMEASAEVDTLPAIRRPSPVPVADRGAVTTTKEPTLNGELDRTGQLADGLERLATFARETADRLRGEEPANGPEKTLPPFAGTLGAIHYQLGRAASAAREIERQLQRLHTVV